MNVISEGKGRFKDEISNKSNFLVLFLYCITDLYMDLESSLVSWTVNMKEIKFRAWDGEKMQYSENPPSFSFWKYVAYDSNCLETLMQFTGLRDRNGKEVYESDIAVVRELHDGDEYVWNNEKQEGFPFLISWKGLGFDFGGSCMDYRPQHYEVIGNIYENPELMP